MTEAENISPRENKPPLLIASKRHEPGGGDKRCGQLWGASNAVPAVGALKLELGEAVESQFSSVSVFRCFGLYKPHGTVQQTKFDWNSHERKRKQEEKSLH
jgi:hypothetical protein